MTHTKTAQDTRQACQEPRCTITATHLVDGAAYCAMDATYRIHQASAVVRIAPTPTRRVSAGCHFCGLPLRGGECSECR